MSSWWTQQVRRLRRGNGRRPASGDGRAPGTSAAEFSLGSVRLPELAVGDTMRAVARAAPETLTLARHHAQPAAAWIARLSVTAVLAYLLAELIPGISRPVLTPLTALLVVQVTTFQTIRHAVRRVISVVAGVLVAVVLTRFTGFTWWSLLIVITAALIVGQALRLGDHLLEVPISAMLVLSLDTTAAASTRIIETLIGAAAGLVGGLVFAPVRVQPAEEAVDDLSEQLSGLLDQMAADLAVGSEQEVARERLTQARASTREVQRVDQALAEADESLRFNPRARPIRHAGIALRDGLETLERVVVTVRALARSFAETSSVPEGDPLADEGVRRCLVTELRHLSGAVQAFGRLVRADVSAGPAGSERTEPVESDLERELAAARHSQDRLTRLLSVARDAGRPGWSIHGELVTNLERLIDELRVEHRARARERWPRRPPRGRRIVTGRRRSRRPLIRGRR